MTGSERPGSAHSAAEALSRYLAGEAAESERGEIAAHLAGCSECTGRLGEIRTLVARLAADAESVPAAGVWEGLASRIDREGARRQPDRRRRWVLTVGAAAVLVLAFALFRQTSTQPDRRQAVLTATPPALAGEITRLEAQLATAQQALTPEAASYLDQGLRSIDRALAEAEQEFRREPADPIVADYVAALRRHKLAALRAALSLIQAEA
jgi:hypothetical protein